MHTPGSGWHDPRPQLLFVDEDSEALRRIHDGFAPERGRWTLLWASDEATALNHLAEGDVDIVVVDPSMSGGSGSRLLEQARRYYPTTARMILSASAHHATVLGNASTGQAFLTKPLDIAALRAALQSALEVRSMLSDSGVRAILGGAPSLPKPPSIYAELVRLTTRPDTGIADIAQVIERDVATSAEVLRLVNSSFFGVGRAVPTIDRAVTLLGLDLITALVVAGNVFRPASHLPPGLDVAALAERGVLAGLAVRRIGATEGWDPQLTASLSLAALLHDVSQVVLATANPAGWATLRAHGPGTPTRAQEIDAFGCTIGQASAYLLGLWGFPSGVRKALAQQPVDLDDPDQRSAASPAALAIAIARRESPILEGASSRSTSGLTAAASGS